MRTTLARREPFVYVEHATVSVVDGSLTAGDVTIPAEAVACVAIGPGCSITSAALNEMSAAGTTLVSVGEHGVRWHSVGRPWGQTGDLAERHAELWVRRRVKVAGRLFKMRWGSTPRLVTLAGLRGQEGVLMRRQYQRLANDAGVEWSRRTLSGGDDINRALSWAGGCLNSVAAAAVHAAGAIPSLGFLHGGGAQSFVYDIADLHRNTVHAMVFHDGLRSERDVRHACRKMFRTSNTAATMIGEIGQMFDTTE